MVLEPIKPRALAVRVIPDVHPGLAKRLKLPPGRRSIGMITCTIDDSLYAALDEGTKAADVEVVYARSFYAGAAHSSGPFSGEIIGIFAAHEPESISSALQAAQAYLRDKAWFFAADERGELAFFPHVIPSVGRYLARQAGVEPGTPLAYLIAPPIESVLGLDAALKAASVELKVFYEPPSETNFAGGLLVGDVPSVETAARAFQDAVLDLARRPRHVSPAPIVEDLARTLGKSRSMPRGTPGKPYALFESGLELDAKPDKYTHLFDDRSLVPKDHPVIRLRGKLDLLQAYVIEAAVAARGEGMERVARDLEAVLEYLRKLLAAEVTASTVPSLHLDGLDSEELHRVSHRTRDFLGVGWVTPSPSMGRTVSMLNLARAHCREVELEAIKAMEAADHMDAENKSRFLHGLNRLSNVIYVLVCRTVGSAATTSS